MGILTTHLKVKMAAEAEIVHDDQSTKTKVLVVDDDPLTCQLLTVQLEMEGYVCKTLSDPGEALEAIGDEAPTVVLLDFHMGDHGGLDLVRTIRGHKEYQHLPIIVMSGLDHQRESKSAGADGFVLKPFSLEDLVATIEEVLKPKEA